MRNLRILTLCVFALITLSMTGCSGDAQQAIDEFVKLAIPLERQAFASLEALSALSIALKCCAGPMALICLFASLIGITGAVVRRQSILDHFLYRGWKWVFLMIMCAMMIGLIPALNWLGQKLWEWAGMDITLFTHNLDVLSIKSALSVIALLQVFCPYHVVYQLMVVVTLPFCIWLAIQFRSPWALVPWVTGLGCFLAMGPVIAIGTTVIAAVPQFSSALFSSINVGVFLWILGVSVLAGATPIVTSGGLSVLWAIQAWRSHDSTPTPAPTPAPPSENGGGSGNGREPWNAASLWMLLGLLFGQRQEPEDDGSVIHGNPPGYGQLPEPGQTSHWDGPIIYGDPPDHPRLPGPGETSGPDAHAAADIHTKDGDLPDTDADPASQAVLSLGDQEADLGLVDVDAAVLEGLAGTGQLPDPRDETAALRQTLEEDRQAFEDKLQKGGVLPSPKAGEPMGLAVRALHDVFWDNHGRPELILRKGDIAWPVDLETGNHQGAAIIESPRHRGVTGGVWLGQEVTWVPGLQLPPTEPTTPPESAPPQSTQYTAAQNIHGPDDVRIIARRGQRIWPDEGPDGTLTLRNVTLSKDDYTASSGNKKGGEA